MSNFNYLRISNLNYNNNTSKIDDQIFYLNGENTMINLRNGGGKTVIIQMMMAPFVRRKYRDLNERKFDSYFNSKTPTYILVEWNLEDGAGYLLTGMMVRKRDNASDEDSKSKLDIINFVYEYKTRNEYDIKSIPIIEDEGRGKRIKSFINSKKLFEELKKNSNYDFNYYDMNNSSSSRAYFDKLKEYGIDNKEWETIIKKVNLTESGLSQLFKEAKNTEGLVKKWFLPIVEEKLNKDENRINNYRDIIEKYIYQYKINKSNIDRKKKIEIFNGKAEGIKQAALEFKNQVSNKEVHKNKIANYYKTLSSAVQIKEQSIFEINENLLKNAEQIKEVEYERVSLKVHQILDEVNKLNENADGKIALKEEYNSDLLSLKREKNILNCADVYSRYTKHSRKLQELEIKIKTLKNEGEDKKPEINNLGYSIRKLVTEDYERKKLENDKSEAEERDYINKSEKLKEGVEDAQSKLNKLALKEGSLKEKVSSFDVYEEKFNRSYSEKFHRNIVGYFDDKEIIVLSEKIDSDKKKAEDEKKNIEKSIIETEQLLKSKTSEKESLDKIIVKLESDLGSIEEKVNTFNNELDSRKDIVRYVNLGEDNVFNNEEIIKEYDKKINLLNSEVQELYKDKNLISEEINRLKTGKIIEIPKEFLEVLKNNDIAIVYGMEWLKKNQYFLKENEEFVRRNPFIPYSLIMDKREINILKNICIEFFTSFPIPIIEREDLEKDISNGSDRLIDCKEIKFYISFNNKLLNEQELGKLLELKKKEEDNLQEKIEEKKAALDLYIDKKVFIKNSILTKELYEETLLSQENIRNQISISRKEIISLIKQVSECNDKIEDYKCKKDLLIVTLRNLGNKKKDYEELLIEYDKYCSSKEEYEEILKVKSKYELQIEKDKKELKFIEEQIEAIKEKIVNLKGKILECNKSLKIYGGYRDGVFIDKDLEDLVAEYNVITKKIYGDILELEEEKRNVAEEYASVEKQLIEKETEFELREEEFRNVVYDFSKESAVEKKITAKEQEIKKIEKEISNLETDIAVKKEKVSSLKKDLMKIANTDVPKDKENIYDKNFKEEIAKLNVEKDKLNEKKVKYESEKEILEKTKTSLEEYEFIVEDEIQIDINLDTLENEVKKMKRDYNLIEKKISEIEKQVYDLITKVSNEDIFKSDSLFKDAIEGLLKVYDDPINLLKQLEVVLDSYNKIVEKLMHDIEIINKEESNILNNLYEYMALVNENIDKIDDNSAINISGKSIKMLKISVVNIEENKELYIIRIKEYIENIRDYCVKLLESNESIKEYIEKSINIIKLYDEIISIGNIIVKLYKIEENKQKQITWDEVAKNSGGEGFLSAFVILSSLLSYMRKEDKDIFIRKEVSKVLIMDNPFAQTNAEHLLKPLIEISKKSRTQLICLTGLGGDSIINRFDNIYVLNLVSSKLKNGLKVIKSDHIVGEEEVEVMVSSQVKSEDIQMRLF